MSNKPSPSDLSTCDNPVRHWHSTSALKKSRLVINLNCAQPIEKKDSGNYRTSQPAWAELLQIMSLFATFMVTELATNAAVYDAIMDLDSF